MTEHRSREPDSGVPSHPTPGSRWRDLDALDRSWSGVAYTRTLTAFDSPGPDRIRAALAAIATRHDEIGRWSDELPPRWRRVEQAELDRWLDRAFVASDEAGVETQQTLDRNGHPLAGVPLRVIAGPDWLSLRMAHTVGDGWTSIAFMGHLLRQAADPSTPRPVPWDVYSQRRRDLVIGREALRHLPTVAHALRHRRSLAGGEYEPAGERADTLVDRTFAVGDAEFPAKVRALRAKLFPDVSTAALVMTGLRAALEAAALPACRPGFECLFNTRTEATARAWGNWSAGVYVRPADDRSPHAVAAELRRVRDSGLPDLAHASLRSRARRSDASTIMMPRAVGAPRLTMSYTAGHVVQAELPGLRAGESDLGTWTRPNGTESITVQAVECAGRISIGLSFFPDVWPADVVCGAVRDFLKQPAPVLASLPGATIRTGA